MSRSPEPYHRALSSTWWACAFPFSREVADFELARDDRLIALEKPGGTNVIVAEVKGGRDTGLSDVWVRDEPDAQQLARLTYLVQWFGFWKSQGDIEEVAGQLRRKRLAERENIAMRAVYFGARRSAQADALGVPQIMLAEIAEWIVIRAVCWKEQKLARRSCHDQWDPLIKNVWNLADPELPGTAECKVASILALAIDVLHPEGRARKVGS